MKSKLIFVAILLIVAFSLTAAQFTDTGWSDVTQVKVGARKYNVWTCTLAVTTADTVCYTAKTPIGLDTSRKWGLLLNTGAVTIDGDTLPVWLYGGYSDDAAIDGYYGSLTLTDVVAFKAVESDVKASIGYVTVDPQYTGADVANVLVNIIEMPYYVVHFAGTTAFSGSVNVVIKIVQLSQY